MSSSLEKLQRFFRELKRRNVYKVAVAYVAVAFVGIQAAGVLVPATTLPEWADSLLIYLAVFGFPLALVVAWAFEMTPEGIRRTEQLEEGGTAGADPESGGTRTAYKLLIGLGLLAAGVAGTWYLTGGGDRPEITDRSVAVLPFETLGQAEATAFTEGIQTGIQNRLSSISGLVVKSRTSAMRYRDSDQPIPEIAGELGVTWVLRGEVQESGSQVQVTARLVHARRDQQIWAGSYERRLTADNLFSVQEEITKKIAQELQTQLSPAEKRRVETRPTENLEAYEMFVRGRSLLERRTEPEVRQAAQLFGRAIARDSSYALAWAGLADALSLLRFYRYAPDDSVAGPSLRAARRAVGQDPGSGVAHASLGIVHSLRQEGPQAIAELTRAIELRPSYAEAQIWLSWVHLMLGHPGPAVDHAREALTLDPLAPAIHLYAAEALLARDSAETALARAVRAREIQPDYMLAHYVEGLVLHHLGRPADADASFRRALALAPEVSTPSRSELGAALAVSEAAHGDTISGRARLEGIDADEDPFSAGLVRAALGDRDGAFRGFQGVERWGSPRVEIFRYYFPGVLGPLREDPRYEQLMREVNRAWGLEPDGRMPREDSGTR